MKEIEKPNIKFYFYFNFSKNDKFYFDENNNEYLIKSFQELIYCNLHGKVHKEDGPALICCDDKHNHYYLNNRLYFSRFSSGSKHFNGEDNFNDWCKITNHLICFSCENFCKQSCF